MRQITLRVEKYDSVVKSMWGLIGVRRPKPVLLSTRFGIHTFGMHFPIDVVILNKDSRVAAIKEKLMPKRTFFWNPRFNCVIELPAGMIRRKKIAIGSFLLLKYKKEGNNAL